MYYWKQGFDGETVTPRGTTPGVCASSVFTTGCLLSTGSRFENHLYFALRCSSAVRVTYVRTLLAQLTAAVVGMSKAALTMERGLQRLAELHEARTKLTGSDTLEQLHVLIHLRAVLNDRASFLMGQSEASTHADNLNAVSADLLSLYAAGPADSTLARTPGHKPAVHLSLAHRAGAARTAHAIFCLSSLLTCVSTASVAHLPSPLAVCVHRPSHVP